MKEQNEILSWRRTLWYWGPVVIWMAIIFIGSSHSNVALSDEVHQMFVPTRTAYLGDIFMDGVGAGMGLLFGIIVYTSLPGKLFSKRSKNKFSWFN